MIALESKTSPKLIGLKKRLMRMFTVISSESSEKEKDVDD